MTIRTQERHLRGASTVVLLFSRDQDLSEQVPSALTREDPLVEVQVVQTVDGLQRRLGHIDPDTILLDIGGVEEEDLPRIVDGALLDRAPTVVIDHDRNDATRRARAMAAGAVDYLQRSDSLIERVQRAVLNARTAGRIAETERHFRDILEASSDGIFVLVGGKFHFANDSFSRALGLTVDGLLDGRGLLEYVIPEQRHVISERLGRIAVGEGTAELFEMAIDTPTGLRIFEVSARSSVVDGHRAVVGVAREVTHLRALEKEVERARKRSAQVERLRVLGELAAGVAHDFNNALGTIVGRVQLARERHSRGAPIADELDVIEIAAKTAIETVRRIQEFTRPDDADSWKEINLAHVLGDVAELARTRVPMHVEFVVDIRATPAIRGNEAELREVFVNLVNNAIDAIAEVGRVKLACFEEDGLAVVEVEDDGQGMPQEVQERIFEPFFSTKAKSGTGLGLSVSHWILRRHDAQLHLASEPGRGTRFRLVFTPPEVSSGPPRHLSADNLRVLVVDDDEAVGELIQDLLIEQGHTVEVVQTAEAMMSLLGEQRYHLVITDLDLPETSGWQIARQVREKDPGILVGLITGWPLGSSDNELEDRGVDFILSKPFSIGALEEALDKIRGP